MSGKLLLLSALYVSLMEMRKKDDFLSIYKPSIKYRIVYLHRKKPGRVAQSVGTWLVSQRSWVRYSVWPRHTFVSPSADSRWAVVSYWRKYVQEILVNRLGGLSLPRKSVVRLNDRPDMTSAVYRGRKTTKQHQQQFMVFSLPTLQRWYENFQSSQSFFVLVALVDTMRLYGIQSSDPVALAGLTLDVYRGRKTTIQQLQRKTLSETSQSVASVKKQRQVSRSTQRHYTPQNVQCSVMTLFWRWLRTCFCITVFLPPHLDLHGLPSSLWILNMI